MSGFRNHHNAQLLVSFAKLCGFSFVLVGRLKCIISQCSHHIRWIGSFLRCEIADEIRCELVLHIQHTKLPIIADVGGLHDGFDRMPSF